MANAAITVDLNARIAQFESELKRANASLDGFARKGSATLTGLKSLGAGLAGALSVGAIASFAKSGIDAADALNDLSQRTGVSVKTLADWKLAATLADTSLDSLAKGVQRLTLSIGQAEAGGKAQAEALKTLGVTARDPQQAFEQLADAVAKSNDPIKTNAALNDVLGRSYAELLPLLQGGAKGLRESAAASQSFSDAMVTLAPSAAKLNDQLDTLKINAAGAAASILADLVPSLNEYIAVGREVINNGTLLDKVRFFGLGNASDELVNRVRINLAASAGWMDKLTASAARANQLGGGGNAATREKPAGASTKTDPLAGLLGSTDIGRTQEYNRLLGLLDARFAGGKKNAELYAQAVAKLNEQFGKATLDPLGSGSFKTTDKATADFISQQQDAINALNSEMAQDGVRAAQEYESALASLLGDTTIAKTEALQESIDVLNRAFFDGTIGVEQYDEAIANLTEGSATGLEKTKSLAEDLGLTFTSAFEDAIVEGEKLSDVLKGLEKDIIRIVTRKMVTEPLGNFVTGALEGFGFADGGIMTGAGPLSLKKYASGGIASTPQLALFGEGSQPEAFVPLPDGRRIPVAMEGGGGTTVVMNITTPDANSFRASQGQITAQYASALQRARRNM